jgi:hypothetical protein
MSMTFDVFPSSSTVPSFRQILELSTARLREFLHGRGFSINPAIEVILHTESPDATLPTNLDSPALWDEHHYAWFSVPPVPGGTDAYVLSVEGLRNQLDEIFEGEEDEMEEPLSSLRSDVLSRPEVRYYWSFRRSAGQPAIINLVYGLIAASVAELTDGIIFNDDGAWDYERFPAKPSEFFEWYFRPEQAIDPALREWSARCIKAIPDEWAT